MIVPELDLGHRIENSIQTRFHLAIDKVREWHLWPYLPGAPPLYNGFGLIMQEADYIMGDVVNVAIKKNFIIAGNLEDVGIKVGHSYRLRFKADNPAKNFSLPGDGFIDLPGLPQRLRIYKIAFVAPDLVDVDVIAYQPVDENPGPVESASFPLVPITIIVAAVAGVLLAVFGYLALQDVKEIIVSPSGLIIGVALLVLLFPAIRGSLGRVAKGGA